MFFGLQSHVLESFEMPDLWFVHAILIWIPCTYMYYDSLQ